ncbi:MAG: hypothetical protein HUU02_00850 [Bacteroidetes bacterium]|nr:hypothetical protein [Bacteroidota bacterium]
MKNDECRMMIVTRSMRKDSRRAVPQISQNYAERKKKSNDERGMMNEEWAKVDAQERMQQQA